MRPTDHCRRCKDLYNGNTVKKRAQASSPRAGEHPAGNHVGKLIVMGADHKGWMLKDRLKAALKRRGWRVADVGTRSGRRVDYPIFAGRIGRRISPSMGRRAVGIGVCSTGIGMALVAGKFPGVLPAGPKTVALARETRTHNNTNFLALGGSEMSMALALKIAEAWLREPFFTDPEHDRAYMRRYLQTVRLDIPKRR